MITEQRLGEVDTVPVLGNSCPRMFGKVLAVPLVVGLMGTLLASGCFRPDYSLVPEPSADYGQAISQAEAEAKAKNWFKTYLKDPLSAQYEWEPVKPIWIRMVPTAFTQRTYGYALIGMVNAKNAYGGYTGFKRYRCVFRNGVLVEVSECEPNMWSQDGQLWVQVYPPPP